jgi:cobalt-zinc-cadmium efflux system outer membrane protein
LNLSGTIEAAPLVQRDDAFFIDQALSNRLDVRLATSQLAAAESELERQFLDVFPALAIGLQAERTDRRALSGRNLLADTARASVVAGQLTAPTIQSKGQRDLVRRQIIDFLLGPSIDVTLPIFDQNQAGIARARNDVMARRKELEDLEDEVARQAGEASVRARTAAELVRFYEGEALPLVSENLENARRLYLEGEQGVIVLLEAQEMLIQQRRAYVDVLRDYAIALAELDRVTGGGSWKNDQAASQPASAPAADRD